VRLELYRLWHNKPLYMRTWYYSSEGVASEAYVVTYCRIGERSAHSWFVLSALLGYPNVKNYDGSWTEYGSLVGVAVEG
jgi:thiosulfate/3-mercaptopyruvate sulfurtransferase